MSKHSQIGILSAPRTRAGFLPSSWARPVIIAACLALSACTTVGMHTKQRMAVEYGPPVQMRVCILRAPGVSEPRVNKLITAVNTELAPYGIEAVVPWMRPWDRPGFTFRRIFDDVITQPLEPPCDRLLAFVDRNVGDFLWGLALPEILGAVNDDTHTHGYVVATGVSVNQLFSSPTETTVHEFYHLLGCPHSGSMSQCYRRIAALKLTIDPATDFLPGADRNGRFLLTRDEVNLAMQPQPEIVAASPAAVAP